MCHLHVFLIFKIKSLAVLEQWLSHIYHASWNVDRAAISQMANARKCFSSSFFFFPLVLVCMLLSFYELSLPMPKRGARLVLRWAVTGSGKYSTAYKNHLHISKHENSSWHPQHAKPRVDVSTLQIPNFCVAHWLTASLNLRPVVHICGHTCARW